jgi:hypothetical protein
MIRQSNDIAISGIIIVGLKGATEKKGDLLYPARVFCDFAGPALAAFSPHYAIAGTATG